MTALNWKAFEQVERERAKRLVIEARQAGMRVRRVSDIRFEVKGYSAREKRIKTHVVHVDNRGLLCDCMWSTRRPYSMCKHTAVVWAYRKRKERNSELGNGK